MQDASRSRSARVWLAPALAVAITAAGASSLTAHAEGASTGLNATRSAPVTAQLAGLFDAGSAAASLQRLLPGQASQFTLIPQAKPSSGKDSYTVSGGAGNIQVAGTSPATILRGVGWYLHNVAHVDISLEGSSVSRLPATLPAVPATHTDSALVSNRFALNDTDNGYSGPYRTYAEFQHEIDVLALDGYNEVYLTEGAGLPYYQALQDFGYSSADLLAWIPAPAYQPWWLMQNISAFSGSITSQLLTTQAAIGKQACDQLRSLGMTPVLPGFFGTVPLDFSSRNGGVNVVTNGTWSGMQRPGWLDPTTATFAKLAKDYYAKQAQDFGDSTMYTMDPLQEGGGSSGTIDLQAAGTAIQQALETAHPGATWVMFGWSDNPNRTMLSGLNKSEALVIDGRSDANTSLNRESDWNGTPYAYGTIPNYGGNSEMGANTGVWLTEFYQWLNKPGSALAGIAYYPEATTTNPAALELFGDLAWSSTPINQFQWFQNYAAYRYGGADPNTAAAWNQLQVGPYSMPAADDAGEPQSGLFTAIPSLTATRISCCYATAFRFDPTTVQTALADLLKASPAVQATDAFRYDIVDVARQALADQSRVLLPQLNAAANAKDLAGFQALANAWNTEEASLDKLLSTDARFMVGPWIAEATAMGSTPTEQNQLAYDARSILTTWGNSTKNSILDYAAREWSGMISGLYAPRWAAYLQNVANALANNTTVPQSMDFTTAFNWDDSWAKANATYPTSPSGDPIAVAKAVASSLPPRPTGPITGIGGNCADITNGSTADGTPLQLYPCNGTAAQTWSLVADGTIHADGKCVDVRAGGTTPGTVVQLYTCAPTTAQQWTHQGNTLVNPRSGLCLDTQGGVSAMGTALVLGACTGSPSQQWLTATLPTGPITGIAGKCADITNGNTADETPLQLYTCHGTAAQTWTVEDDGTLHADGKCMDVHNGSTTPGTAVQLYHCNGTPAQGWLVRADGTLMNTKSGLCLDASGGSSADNTPLIIWTCTAKQNQLWTLPS